MFQRLMAIPQDEYMQLTAVQQARQPMTQQFYNLENRYQQQENIDNSYDKMMQQSETLQQMKNLKEKMRQDIVISTPKPYQTRARTLFQTMEPFIKFNQRGEIFSDDGQVIPNSRLEDLIQYAVRDRRRNVLPVAWSHFMDLMRRHNAPRFVLNHETLEEMKPQFKIPPFSNDPEISPTKGTTPRKKAVRKTKSDALKKLFDEKRKVRDMKVRLKQKRKKQDTDFLRHY